MLYANCQTPSMNEWKTHGNKHGVKESPMNKQLNTKPCQRPLSHEIPQPIQIYTTKTLKFLMESHHMGAMQLPCQFCSIPPKFFPIVSTSRSVI